MFSSGIFLLVISGKIGSKNADRKDKAHATIITVSSCNISNPPNKIPKMAPILAAKEQIPFRLVLKKIS